jgi:hypothetical protein
MVGFILLFLMQKEGFVTRYSSCRRFYSAEIKLSIDGIILLMPCLCIVTYFKYSEHLLG